MQLLDTHTLMQTIATQAMVELRQSPNGFPFLAPIHETQDATSGGI